VTAVRRDHVAGFYDRDDDLVAAVAPHVADGLVRGEAVVVVATPPHLRAVEAALAGRGIGLDRFLKDGLFVALDAERALAALTVDGVADRERFGTVIGDVVAGAAAHAARVRAFGEMVGLLWARGDVAGALALESRWNELCDVHDLSLWCAYPATSLADAELGAISDVCSEHSGVVAPAGDAPGSVVRVGDGGVSEASQVFLPSPVAAGAVRRFVSRAFESWHVDGMSSDAVLVASELATNAVLHASSPFRVTLRRSGDSVTVAVADCDPAGPRCRHSLPEAVGGRGLFIVAGVSSEWGTEARPDGKTVWATLTPAI